MRSDSFYTICIKVYNFYVALSKFFIYTLCDLMCMYDMYYLVSIYMFMSDLVTE